MTTKKYASLSSLQDFLDNLDNRFLSKAEFDSYEFITMEDIDEICGGLVDGDLTENDIDELMARLK